MRRFRALIPAVLSFLLLSVCIIAGFVSQHRILRWGFSTLHNRYSFLIDHQEFLIRASPPPRKEDAEAWELLKRLRNDDVKWSATWFDSATSDSPNDTLGPYLDAGLKQGSVAWKLSNLSSASDEPFLRALDSPKKFIAAQVILVNRHNRRPLRIISGPLTYISMSQYQSKGVQVHLLAPELPHDGSFMTEPVRDSDVIADPSQLPAIRDIWHDALDQTILSVSIWWAAGVATFLLVFQCVGALRRAKRHRSGLCPRCGYDLRASTGVCPECGAPIPKNASTPSTV